MVFERYELIGLVFSLIIVVFDFYLLKERKIRGKAFVFWLVAATILGLFSVVPTLSSMVGLIFGTQFTISGIVAAFFLLFVLTTFYFHYRLNELQSMLTKLAMEISARKYTGSRDPSDLSEKSRESNNNED